MRIDNNINCISKISSNHILYPELNVNNDVNASDNYDVSSFDLEAIDYKKLTKSTLEILSKNYKNINIYILEKGCVTDINRLARNLGDGKHLVISRDFIDKMGSSEEAYIKGKAILEQTLKDMSSSDFELNNGIKSFGAFIDDKSINYWLTYEKPFINNQTKNNIKLPQNRLFYTFKGLEKKADKSKDKYKVKKPTNIKIPMEVYSRLAGARTKPEVMRVVSIARMNISNLKKSLKDSDDNEKIKIKAIINQLEKAITRSYRKIKELASEDSLIKGRKSAELKERKRLAAHKNEELNRKRVIRRIREKAQIDEANPLYYYPQMFLNKKNESEEDESNIQTIDSLSIAPSVGVIDVSVSMPVQQNIEVTVMPAISISL